MSDDPVATRVECVAGYGTALDLHFQEYWVRRRARDEVKAVRFEGASEARPAPGVVESIAAAHAVVVCPSNPVASIAPILAVPGIVEALTPRRDRVVGISPIVGGAPLRGMADRLMPSAGLEVSAYGAAAACREVAGAWVVDERDADLGPRIESDLGMRVGVTDTIMTDDDGAARLAGTALELIG